VLRLTNEANSQPLPIGAVTVAIAGAGLNVRAGTTRKVHFNGQSALSILGDAPVGMRLRRSRWMASSLLTPARRSARYWRRIHRAPKPLWPPVTALQTAESWTRRMFAVGRGIWQGGCSRRRITRPTPWRTKASVATASSRISWARMAWRISIATCWHCQCHSCGTTRRDQRYWLFEFSRWPEHRAACKHGPDDRRLSTADRESPPERHQVDCRYAPSLQRRHVRSVKISIFDLHGAVVAANSYVLNAFEVVELRDQGNGGSWCRFDVNDPDGVRAGALVGTTGRANSFATVAISARLHKRSTFRKSVKFDRRETEIFRKRPNKADFVAASRVASMSSMGLFAPIVEVDMKSAPGPVRASRTDRRSDRSGP
jgi:hypothetical protein